jgi:hypothetical protein
MLQLWTHFLVFAGVVLLLLTGLALLFGLVPAVVSLFEKRSIRNLVPLETQEKPPSAYDPGPHPYMDAVNEYAGQMGFEFGGIFVRATKGGPKFRVALWRSPERDIFVTVAILQAGPLRQKITSLGSQVGSRYLVTADDFGEDDISGLLDYEVLKNADFPELLKRHEDRLAQSDGEIVFFVADNMLEDLEAVQCERARRMVDLGYAKFLDFDRSVWSYTIKGAVHLYFRSYLKQLLRGVIKGHRQLGRRPGS